MPPVIVSLINLKGGVGKTTTTVQLAECLASEELRKRVLVIDLDPQTNETIALIDESHWEIQNDNKQTIAHLFNYQLESTSNFKINSAILKGVSNLELNTPLNLLPSSIELVNIQDHLSDIPQKTRYRVDPVRVLSNTVAEILNNYDYVLIDCPPNLGLITQNGLELSDFYLIPTIPDTLSTYGVPQIIKSIHQFTMERGLKALKCFGLIFTKYQANSSVHTGKLSTFPSVFRNTFLQLGLTPAPVFETKIPQSNDYANPVEVERKHATFKQKWGYAGRSDGKKLHEIVTDLTKEFIKHASRRS